MKASLAHEIRWPRRIRTPADAIRFLDAVGFCVLFPLTKISLPSLSISLPLAATLISVPAGTNIVR
ncbi:MAG: hypothetical protein HY012_01985 [Acidobacteria bacterium]|nr:hypothetical protein [Acidobacteriota bacterium]